MVDNENKIHLVVVLGMHRSGSSAITRLLLAMNIDLGDNLMLPIKGNNDKGFWEDVDINSLNIQMLNAIGYRWYQLAPLTNENVDLLVEKGFYDKALTLLRSKVKVSSIFGFKDPRLAKLIPFWKRVFKMLEYKVSYILTSRSPYAVAQSLELRDKFPRKMGCWLWFGHVITALYETQNERCIVCDYDQLMDAPLVQANRLAGFLQCQLVLEKFEAYINDFLDEGLRRIKYCTNLSEVNKFCPPMVSHVYQHLLSRIGADEMDAQSTTVVDGWYNNYLNNDELFTLLDEYFLMAANQGLELNKLRAENTSK